MAVIKASALEGFLRKRDPAIGAILIYGGDPGTVRDLACKVVQRVAGSLDDPFNVVSLEESAMSGDPGRIIDEVLSLSFLGGNRVVWVRGADQNFLKSVEPILDGSVRGNLIVADAGNLSKSSALRSKFEASDHAVVLPVYEADTEAAAATIESQLQRMGLRIGQDAKARLVELAGRGGVTLLREIEKLAIYCHGASSVGLEDVEAVCGDGMWAGVDDLADAIFAGDVAGTDRFFMQLVTSGVDPGRLLSAAHGHALRLIDFRQSVDRGTRIEQAVKSARPPIFFKRLPAIQNQLAAWTSESLLSAAASLSAAILQARLNSGLAGSIANRSLLAVARSSRTARLRLN